MKKGLVLEGGAMRGIFTAGVIDVLMENHITFDGAIGVSAGACFGVNLKSKQIGRTFRYNMKYAKDPRYASVQSWIKTGDFFNAEFCYHTLPEKLDPMDATTYSQNPMTLKVESLIITMPKILIMNRWTLCVLLRQCQYLQVQYISMDIFI